MNAVDSLPTNPFPGLRPFRSDEHHLFFGREEQTGALLQLLRTNRFLAVVGTSGSGKSSLVRAGMIAALYGGTMTQAGSNWEVMILRPGGSPIENLARAFVESDLYDPADPSTLPRLLATLNRSRFGLVEAMKQSAVFEPDTNLLVVVDQFEELFRFRQQNVDSEETAAAFVNLLLTAGVQMECPIYVTITMRSDYLGDCSEIPGLAEAVNDGEYLIPRLLRDQKRDAIEKPIGVCGAKISPMLVQRLLNDVGDDPDQLPVLQHALMRMWDAWSTGGDRDRPIDFADFEATGGLGAALSNHADEIYDSLPHDRHRTACEKIFKTLTVKGDDNRGIRRPTRLAQLQAIADSDRDTVTTVLDAFRGSGVTFLMPGAEVRLDDRTVLDLSHESLMRGWQRLRMWVEDEAQSARIFRRLLDTARLWSDGKAGLFRDPDLQIALTWREQVAPNTEWAEQYGGHLKTAISFLETSNAEAEAERQAREAARQRELEQARQLAEAQQLRLEQQQRAARRLRVMIAGLAAVALIAGVACALALFANQRAITLAAAARQNEERARQNEEKAKQNATRAEESQQETASALAVVASQKAQVEGSLSKAETAERLARASEETGRKLLYTTDMRLAPFVWRDDRTTAEQLRVLLAKHIPDRTAVASKDAAGAPQKSDLRGFEWYYYQHLLQESSAVFSGHGGAVVDGAFTADGTLLTLDENGQLRRWDLSSQAEDLASRRDLPGGPGDQVRVLSPDGRLAAQAEGNKVHVFDPSTGGETIQIDSANTRARHMVLSGDGDRLVIVDDRIRWCSARGGEVIAAVNQSFDRIEGLALSADGLTLAVTGHGETGRMASVFRLDAASKTVTLLAKDFGAGGTLRASALSPNGERIAVGAKLSGSLFVFDTATGSAIAAHGSAHASPIAAMAFSRDGMKMATADAEGTIKIWAEPQKLNSKSTALLTLKGHRGPINRVGFSIDGKRLITTSGDKTARVWDLDNAGAAITPLERSESSVVVRFSPDGQLIGSADGSRLHLWDAATGRLVRELSAGDKGRVCSVAFSPTDNRLLAAGYGGEAGVSHVALWDIDAGTELARLPGATDLDNFQVTSENGPVGALEFSPDGQYLVAGFGSKNMLVGASIPTPVKAWEVATRRLVRHLNGHTNYCVSLDFSRDGTLLASGSRDGTAILWSTATWKATRTLRNSDANALFPQGGRRGMVEGVAFSPDGKTLAMASREANVQLWDVATGKLLEALKGHSSAVLAVVFSPDGRTLASGGTDQTVRLWNVETRRELMQLNPGDAELGQIQSLAFSPDGQQLLAGGSRTACWSTAPIVWNDTGRAAAELRDLLQSNADFQSRIRMSSENLRLHEGLAKLDAKDKRVRAALAATQANWHASRKAWPEAVLAFDRLVAADPTSPDGWLRTPGLLRLATALVHENRPREAAALLTGGARRRAADGLPPAVDRVSVGTVRSTALGQVRVVELLIGSPAARSDLLPGDVILKVDDTELTRASLPKLGELLDGEAGTKVRLTVRHSGSEKPAVIELTRERFVNDPATGELLYPLREAVKERLDKAPRDAGLLELRAELAGQWSDAKAQLADYTAAILALAQRKTEAAAKDLKRLHGRRAGAHLALREWQEAVDDYARAVTDATTDDALLSGQALALAETLLSSKRWTVLKPTEMKSALGATLALQEDGSAFVSGKLLAKETYTLEFEGIPRRIRAIRLEALRDDRLPKGGPGTHWSGNFVLSHLAVFRPDERDPAATKQVPLRAVFATFEERRAETSLSEKDQDAGWSVHPATGESHSAIFAIDPYQERDGAQRMRIVLDFRHADLAPALLGRFRFSVSSDEPKFIASEESKRLRATSLTDPWQKLAAAYRLQGDQSAIDRLVERHLKSAGPIGDLFTEGKDDEKDWRRAIACYSKGITEKTTDALLLSKRALAQEALKNWDAATADWSRAATGNPDGPKLLADFARRLAAGGQAPLAKAQFEQSEALYARRLREDPEDDIAARELAQLLFDKEESESQARWTVLKPSEMKSKGGATLSKLPDLSILASGRNEKGDVYTIVAQTQETQVRAIRLEVLTHESLPNQGPGRSGKPMGCFAMVNFKITAHIPGTVPRPIEVSRVAADHRFLELTANDWNITGGEGRSHTAVYLAKQPLDCKDGTRLEFQMEFSASADWPLQNLGRFRLSVSSNPAAFEVEQTRFAASKLTDPWAELASAYAVNGRNDQASQYFDRALQNALGSEARKPIVELASRFDDVLSALIDRRPDEPDFQLARARNLAQRGKELLGQKQPARAQAELARSHDVYARLRAQHPDARWTVLTPTEMKSQGDETLTVESDGSIFVSGPNPSRAVYTLKLRTDLPTVTAIRLETIPDARLPQGGAGRFGNGNFHLAEFTAAVEPGRADGKPIPIEFGFGGADVSTPSQNQAGSPSCIDGNPRTYWDGMETGASLQESHWVVFVLKAPPRINGGSVRVMLDSGISQWNQHGLGRFRFSATGETNALALATLGMDLKDSELADLNVALAKAHAQQGQINEAVTSLAEAFPLAADRAGKARIITEAATLEGVLEKLAERASGDGQFQAELARHHAKRGNTPMADAARTRARALFEENLAKEPESSTWAVELADLLLPPIDPKVVMAVSTSENEGVSWRFSTTQPPADWMSEAFDDSAWKTGPGSFGSGAAQGLVVRTEWKTTDIWLRRKFEWKPDPAFQCVLARVIHDDGFELFINGKQVLFRLDFITAYNFYLVDASALSLLKPGINTMSVHCRSTAGYQYIDVGLLGYSSKPDVVQQNLTATKSADPWAKLAAAYHVIGDRPALDRLLIRHPAATTGIGDLYTARQDWKRAIDEYDKAITSGDKDVRTFVARAEAHEKLEQWELAAADWQSVDLHVGDKTVRYGNPSYPAMERRALIHQRLEQYEKVVLDCNLLLKPERLGNHPWILLSALRLTIDCGNGRKPEPISIGRSIFPSRRSGVRSTSTAGATSPRRVSGSRRWTNCIRPTRNRRISGTPHSLVRNGGRSWMRH